MVLKIGLVTILTILLPTFIESRNINIPLEGLEVKHHRQKICVTIRGEKKCIYKNDDVPGDAEEVSYLVNILKKYENQIEEKENGSPNGNNGYETPSLFSKLNKIEDKILADEEDDDGYIHNIRPDADDDDEVLPRYKIETYHDDNGIVLHSEVVPHYEETSDTEAVEVLPSYKIENYAPEVAADDEVLPNYTIELQDGNLQNDQIEADHDGYLRYDKSKADIRGSRYLRARLDGDYDSQDDNNNFRPAIFVSFSPSSKLGDDYNDDSDTYNDKIDDYFRKLQDYRDERDDDNDFEIKTLAIENDSSGDDTYYLYKL